MNLVDLLRLLVTAALWGGSFIVIRACVPLLGPAVLTEARVGLAAIFLLLIGKGLRKKFNLFKHAKHFIILGFLNAAFPFFLFAYSAQYLPGSLLSIINAASPSWGFIFACFMRRERCTGSKVIGLILGVIGVVLLVDLPRLGLEGSSFLPYLCALIASMSYGLASNVAANSRQIDAFQNTLGSMSYSALILIPLMFLFPVNGEINVDMFGILVLFGVVCTGMAFLIYFKLIESVGSSSALTVTFLIPVFGVIWGVIFLDEKVGPNIFLSIAFIIYGTILVTGYRFRSRK